MNEEAMFFVRDLLVAHTADRYVAYHYANVCPTVDVDRVSKTPMLAINTAELVDKCDAMLNYVYRSFGCKSPQEERVHLDAERSDAAFVAQNTCLASGRRAFEEFVENAVYTGEELTRAMPIVSTVELQTGVEKEWAKFCALLEHFNGAGMTTQTMETLNSLDVDALRRVDADRVRLAQTGRDTAMYLRRVRIELTDDDLRSALYRDYMGLISM